MKSPRKRRRKTANPLERLAHTGDGVFAVDRHQHIIVWNQAAETLLGYRAQESLGKNCYDVIRGCDSSGVVVCKEQCSLFEAAKSLRLLPNKNLCARAKNGAHVWINVTTLSLFSRRGKLSKLLHVFRKAGEITDLPERGKESAGPEVKLIPGSFSQTQPRHPKNERNSKSVPLTDREHTILCQLAEGMSTKAIGERFCISPITVKNHVQSILKKLQVHSRVEAVALAFHRGLV